MHAPDPTAFPPSSAPQRPTARFMRAHPAHFIALGFGAGLSPVAPGTAGTLWAWLAWLVLAQWFNPLQLGVVIGVATLVGWWACTVTASHLRVLDPGNIVWDEVVAFWLVLWLVMPTGFWGQLAAFALFRARALAGFVRMRLWSRRLEWFEARTFSELQHHWPTVLAVWHQKGGRHAGPSGERRAGHAAAAHRTGSARLISGRCGWLRPAAAPCLRGRHRRVWRSTPGSGRR